MSETTDKEARRAARAAKGATTNSENRNRSFTVVAHDDGVVLVETTSGRSWTLVEADGNATWHSVDFAGGGERPPRGKAKSSEA